MTTLVPVKITLPDDLHRQLVDQAAANSRTISAEVRLALRAYLGQPASGAA